MTQNPPETSDDHIDLAAFSPANDESSATAGHDEVIDALYGGESGPLGTEPPAPESDSESLYGEKSAAPASPPTDLGAVFSSAEDCGARDGGDDPDTGLCTVTNPALTVSVSAIVGGATQRIDLSPDVMKMTESQLAEEICALADVARLKGQASLLHSMMAHPKAVEAMGVASASNPTEEAAIVFEAIGMPLATPEQAAAAQAEVFATRYGTIA
ncbi:MAG: DUF2694 domain-containing protein [Mycobacterium sp.]